MLHFKVKLQTCEILLCGRLHNNSYNSLIPNTYKQKCETGARHPWYICRGSKSHKKKIKCYFKKWYLLELLWDSAVKWRLSNNSPNLKIDFLGGMKLIQWLPPSQASWILGTCVSTNGSSQEHTAQLRKITTSWAYRDRSGQTRREDTWHYYQ